MSWNSAATRILGHTEEEALGQRLELVIPERYRDLHRTGIARYTQTGEAHLIGKTVELSALTKSGVEIPIELSLSTWTVRGDRYYTGIIRDIGERKAAEEALQRSEEELRAKGEELRSKNAALEETLEQISQMQDQLVLQEKMASLGKLSAGHGARAEQPRVGGPAGASQAFPVFAKLQEAQLQLGRLGLRGPSSTGCASSTGWPTARADRRALGAVDPQRPRGRVRGVARGQRRAIGGGACAGAREPRLRP